MYIDSIVLLILGYSIFSGYNRGFVLSLKTFLMLSVGVILSYILSKHVASLISPTKEIFFYVTFTIIFIICIQIFRILLKKLEVFLLESLKKSDLIWVNSLLGALIGFLKVVFVVFFIVSIIGAFQIRSLMKPIAQTTVTTSLYSLARNLTGVSLMKSLRGLSQNSKINEANNKIKKQANRYLKEDRASLRKP